jgi:DGQHR domain-containing protein
VLYSFAVDGKQIPSFATISRIRRHGTELQGYQRPEVLSHVAEIRTYLESDSPMVPNAIVVAFDSRVVFEPQHDGPAASQYARAGKESPRRVNSYFVEIDGKRYPPKQLVRAATGTKQFFDTGAAVRVLQALGFTVKTEAGA